MRKGFGEIKGAVSIFRVNYREIVLTCFVFWIYCQGSSLNLVMNAVPLQLITPHTDFYGIYSFAKV